MIQKCAFTGVPPVLEHILGDFLGLGSPGPRRGVRLNLTLSPCGRPTQHLLTEPVSSGPCHHPCAAGRLFPLEPEA